MLKLLWCQYKSNE